MRAELVPNEDPTRTSRCPSSEEFQDLWSRLNALSARCLLLALELATERIADSPRTDGPVDLVSAGQREQCGWADL